MSATVAVWLLSQMLAPVVALKHSTCVPYARMVYVPSVMHRTFVPADVFV